MAAKDSRQLIPLKAVRKSTISISHDRFQKAKKNQQRVRVIESDCYLDILLKTLLKLIFMRWNNEVKKQFDPEAGGALVSLTHKARLIYSLDYIDKTTLDDLKQIRKIRNHFAHNINTTFTAAKVCRMVDKLSVVADSKFTTKYRIFRQTVEKCSQTINSGMEQEVIRKAVLKKFEKEQSQ